MFGLGKINKTQTSQINAKLTAPRRDSTVKWKNMTFRIRAAFKSNPNHLAAV